MKPQSAKAKGNKARTLTKSDEYGRVCTKCNQYKLWDSFVKVSLEKTKTGKSAECKKCKVEQRRKDGRNYTREKLSEKQRRAILKRDNPYLLKARLIRTRLIGRFKDKENKSLTPSAEIILEWLQNQEIKCFYSGVTLDLDNITIDHKIPIKRGGTNKLSNLCIASHHMNSAKGSMTDREFKALLKLISKWEDGGNSLLRRLKQGHFG